jgi:hypothetical protein
MSQKPLLSRSQRWFLGLFTSKKYREAIFEDIEAKYLEISKAKGFIEARRYLWWEIYLTVSDGLLHHLKIMLCVEGIIRLTKFLF